MSNSNILLTELVPYAEFSINQVIHRNHEESDLQCNFSHFRNYMRKIYNIFFIILILRALDLSISCMECCCCCSPAQAETDVNQSFLDFQEIFLKSH